MMEMELRHTKVLFNNVENGRSLSMKYCEKIEIEVLEGVCEIYDEDGNDIELDGAGKTLGFASSKTPMGLIRVRAGSRSEVRVITYGGVLTTGSK